MNRSRNIIITLIIVLVVLIIALVAAMVYIFMDQDDTAIGNGNQNNAITNNNVNNEADNGDIEELEVETFNAIFERYEGTDITSSQIKALLSQIEINNTTGEHIITLNEDGIITMEQIEDNKTYNVEFSYDDDGFIKEVKITDTTEDEENNENTTVDMEKLIFNTTFTSYLGDVTGAKLNTLIQEIQESNGKNPEHQITVSSNNLQSLNGIVETDIYTITLSYNDDGYVSNINIDKKI